MILLIAVFLICAAPAAFGKKKTEPPAPPPPPPKSILEQMDLSKLVWPSPPAITRVKYLTHFANEKYVPPTPKQVKHSTWMDRLAGTQSQSERVATTKPLYALNTPYGLAVDSKGFLYVADGKTGAVFIFNTETKDAELLKHNVVARFGFVVGLAIDDDDRLFASDSQLNHVLVLNPQHRVVAAIEGLHGPGGLAIDTENRFLYIADTQADVVLVYDADSLKFLRKIGTPGKKHTLTTPGDFSYPTNVAVDHDGNLYVTDLLNDRVEIFDADGNFIRAWGKNGDGPGYFARPKGIAIDADGHVWVADAVQDRLQCFTPEGQLLMYLGTHGNLPGQFADLAGLAIDKQNRIFTSEQYPGRVQMFRYITNTEARAEFDRRKAEVEKKNSETAPAGQAQAEKPPQPPAGAQTATQPAPAKAPGDAVK